MAKPNRAATAQRKKADSTSRYGERVRPWARVEPFSFSFRSSLDIEIYLRERSRVRRREMIGFMIVTASKVKVREARNT